MVHKQCYDLVGRKAASYQPYATPAATQSVDLERGSNGCHRNLVSKLMVERTLRVVASTRHKLGAVGRS